MPAIIHTTSTDIDEDLTLQCGKRTPALCPPGRTREHKRPPSTRKVQAMVVRKVVLEALHPRHAHTRLWRPGFETGLWRDGGRIHTGPNKGNPG